MRIDPREFRVINRRLRRAHGRAHFPDTLGRVRKNNVNPWYRRNYIIWDDGDFGGYDARRYAFDLRAELALWD